MKLENDLVVLDLEATGTWIEKDKIIEIAMIKRSPSGEQTSYHQRVNPGMPIPAAVSNLTGIKDSDVEKAPSFDKIAKEVLAFFEGCDLAGFNLERYDLPLLAREFEEAGHNFDWSQQRVYDAQKVFHLNEKRDLTAAYQFYCDKELKDAHSAMADTKATLEILEQQVKKYGKGEDTIKALQSFQYKQSKDYYDEERKFRWWNGKLYMMFGKYARKYSLQEVAKMDRGYLEWILSADFSDEVKRLVSDAINGRFPVYSDSAQGELFEDITDEDAS